MISVSCGAQRRVKMTRRSSEFECWGTIEGFIQNMWEAYRQWCNDNGIVSEGFESFQKRLLEKLQEAVRAGEAKLHICDNGETHVLIISAETWTENPWIDADPPAGYLNFSQRPTPC